MEEILASVPDDNHPYEYSANLNFAGKLGKGESTIFGLSDQLDYSLRKFQAKPYGICPVSRRLYDQCFELLIKQISQDCAQRGKLLEDVRSYVKETILTYDKLYSSALRFALRKVLSQSEETNTSGTCSNETSDNVETFDTKAKSIDLRLQQLSEDYERSKAQLETDHSDKLTKLKTSNLYLRKQFATLLEPITKQ